jgi:glutaredoxin-like protein
MAKLLTEDVVKQIEEAFAPMKEAVHIMFFGQKEGCDYCADTQQLLEEVVEISDKLSVEIYDLDGDADVAEKFNVDKAPGIVMAAKDGETISDYGIRYAGIPSGHEFTSLIQDILLVAGRDSGLTQDTRDFLKELTEPVLLQVFVTPT